MATEQVLEWIENHRSELVDFVLAFGDVASPRGSETAAGDYLADWFERHGFRYRTQPVVGDRANVVGTLTGRDPDAERLVFNGHIDTAFGNPGEDGNVLASQTRFHEHVWQDGDVFYGDDVVNDKGQIGAFLYAARAIQETVGAPPGDLHLAGVVGEICGATVGKYQDPQYVGSGVGTRTLVDGGVTGDYAIVAETTDFAVARTECGVAWFEITIHGEASYQPRLVVQEPAELPQAHPGALPKAAHAVLALEEWASTYSNRTTAQIGDETIRPSAGVGAIRSGNPQAPAVAPGVATIYLDVRLPPGKQPSFVRPQIESVLEDYDDVQIEQYLFRRGYTADPERVAPLVEWTEDAHKRVRGTKPPAPAPEITSMWRDINVFNEVGVPAVTVGPPRVVDEVDGERAQGLKVDDIVDAAKLYALIALSPGR